VLITPDDVGGLKGRPQQYRARQNVIFELGFLIGKLGGCRVCVLIQGRFKAQGFTGFLGVLRIAPDYVLVPREDPNYHWPSRHA
jgi:hypothetical protein